MGTIARLLAMLLIVVVAGLIYFMFEFSDGASYFHGFIVGVISTCFFDYMDMRNKFDKHND